MSKEPENGLGSALRLLRQAARLSVEKAAERAEIGRKTLTRWELGQARPRVPELERLLAALDASPAQRRACLEMLNAPRAFQRLGELGELGGAEGFGGRGPHGGDLLRAMRLRRAWSQGQLAEALGIAQSTVARWERNDAWPDDSSLHALCYHLHAEEVELQALTMSRFALLDGGRSGDGEPETLEEVEEACREARRTLRDPRLYRLSDLTFLALEARAAPLAARSEAGRLLLARILLWQAGMVGERGQALEAGRRAERAAPLLARGGYELNDLRLEAELYILVARQPIQRHAAMLAHWRGKPLSLRYERWVLAQSAASLSEAGLHEQAIALSEKACAVARRHHDPEVWQHARNGHALVVLEAGRAAEAADMMAPLETSAPKSRFHAVLNLAEAHTAAGSLSAAHDWLARALDYHALLKIPYYDPQLQALARLF